ncbi:thymidylate kinase [Leptotrichia sp. OH3620_COT-345]|uniref:dTMP kinase n=1 Tax=Leptotrichia sp. OH3620_COT-345 TaxID=2491048 RepID=UPI000F646662|nr:thymidylate kinase [Leptotrichia sp. OH3620_COT-345]RRD40340.1 thymidylate kinase [Leptotrichia sp. OH3620_COT-345]
MGKLIIIEGTDGSGKQTQTALLYEKLCEIKGKKNIKKISFPNYESKASEPVKMYLAGEFGKNVDSVNAYAASLFYSVDRYASFKKEWEKFYNKGGIVISDRYTTSNMVHQTPKIKNEEEREKFLEWLTDLEWKKISIPKPDLVFFLDVPFEFSQKLMKERNNKITGEEKKDIHESDKEYLKSAYNLAKELAIKYNWIIISCVKDNKLKSVEEINNEIMEKIIHNI